MPKAECVDERRRIGVRDDDVAERHRGHGFVAAIVRLHEGARVVVLPDVVEHRCHARVLERAEEPIAEGTAGTPVDVDGARGVLFGHGPILSRRLGSLLRRAVGDEVEFRR